jgi:phosphopantothenoylcysteine decarboxylase/phosphopantothenate--cysteine ligase
MNVWITGGGTREPIDAVRYLGNYSTGRLALELTAQSVARGHEVTAFLAEAVPEPAAAPLLRVRRFLRSQDLADALLGPGPSGAPSVSSPDVILHAAAVSDYAPRPVDEKVASGKAVWNLELHQLPKIAPRLPEQYPTALLVLFKLETGITPETLKERALAAGRAARAGFVFANLLEHVGDRHTGWLVDVNSEEATEIRGRREVAAGLLDQIEFTLQSRRS